MSANVGIGATPPEPGMQEGANGLSPNTSQLSTTYNSRDQRGVTLATLGQGDIHLQDPEASDDPAGLNRDTTQTDRELYRIEQQRQIDLTVDHRLLNEAGRAEIREQIATLPATVKAAYDEVATQVTLLTHPAPDAAVEAGGQITEDLYEALIRRGYSLEDATAILADEAFQDGVLASMKTIAEVSGPLMGGETPAEEVPADATLSNAYYDDQGLPVLELETQVVTAERLPDTPAQVVLKGASEINAYLEQHPEQQQIVEIGFAVAQGPKGVIGLLVGEALANSPVGEALGEKLYDAGELVAEWVEGYDLYGDQDEQDRYLIGGGTFAAGIVSGMAPGGKRGDGHAPNRALTRDELITGLPQGTKITPEDLVDIRRLPDGRTVWLETGNDAAGLQHIYRRHEVDFSNKGIPREEISTVVMDALERGNIVGTNGSVSVYRVTHNGIEQNIAIGVGSNGFVVRANPVSSWKSLP